MITEVPYDRHGHLTRVAADVGGHPVRFLVDTGIGVNVVSTALAARLGLSPTGTSFTGRRMSGQAVTAPLVRLPVLRLGELEIPGQVAGVADLDDATPPPAFDGILGLACFEEYAVTTDPAARLLSFGATGSVRDGVRVPLEIRRDGPSVAPFARLRLPGGQVATVEVDTGSEALILDAGYLDRGEVSVDDLESTTGVDETGHHWTRRLGVLDGSVHLEEAPATGHRAPAVILQDIIHDGLVGTEYLERFRYTVDVAAGSLILADV